MYRQLTGISLMAIAALMLTPNVAAADVLPDHEYGPLTGIFGFPGSDEGGSVTAYGEFDWSTSLGVASHSIDESVGNEDLRLDGETTRLRISYRVGVTNRLDIGVELPYVWHQSGGLDSLIDDWHRLFGLPEGSRATLARDQLEFSYANSNGMLVNLSDNARGLGDVRLLAGWQLRRKPTSNIALRISIKVPTGDSGALLGSGGTDISFGIAGDANRLWRSDKMSGYYRASVIYLGEPERLADRYKDLVGQLAFGLGYRVHPKLDLRAQFLTRTAVYDSNIDNLGAASVSMAFGAALRLSDQTRLLLSVGEDVKPGSAPDVSFQIALRYHGR